MWKIVVPEKPFLAPVDFVAKRCNQTRIEVEFFPQPDSKVIPKEDFSFGDARMRTIRPYYDCRTIDRWTKDKLRDEMTVAGEEA